MEQFLMNTLTVQILDSIECYSASPYHPAILIICTVLQYREQAAKLRTEFVPSSLMSGIFVTKLPSNVPQHQ